MAYTKVQLINPKAVGVRLRRLREEAGLSQRELSGPGVSYAYISRIENGRRTPSLNALHFLANQLAVDPVELATGLDSAPCPFCGR